MTESAAPLQQEGYDLMSAAFAVYRELGHGFLEEVYQESLEIELGGMNLPFNSHPRLDLVYKGRPLRKKYEPDLIVSGGLVVELKAVKSLAAEHEAQLLHYLHATGKRVGYLINFGSFPKLEWKRFVL